MHIANLLPYFDRLEECLVLEPLKEHQVEQDSENDCTSHGEHGERGCIFYNFDQLVIFVNLGWQCDFVGEKNFVT